MIARNRLINFDKFFNDKFMNKYCSFVGSAIRSGAKCTISKHITNYRRSIWLKIR